MMARYLPAMQEFRIYTTNNKLFTLDEDSHAALLTINREKKLFVIKSRHCLRCSQTSDYFCEPTKQWLFQQELGHFFVVSSQP